MVKIVNTTDLDESSLRFFSEEEQLYIYNGLDCAVTREILPKQKAQALYDEHAQGVYAFEREMLAVAIDMMRLGIKIDAAERAKAINDLERDVMRIERNLNKLAYAVWGKELNPNSPKQLKTFFYEVMQMPKQYKFEKGRRTVTTNRDALEALQLHYWAAPFCAHILAIRELKKDLSVLRSAVDSDSRMRFSLNVGATETGRWSSSKDPFNSGTNGQNITNRLRRVFIADDGYKLINVDLSQAESYIMGLMVYYTTGDDAYLRAAQSGDLHTFVARMVWPQLKWPEGYDTEPSVLKSWLTQARTEVAEDKFYRDFSYRDMAKRGGHGTNYNGKPPTMAKHLHVAVAVIKAFQEAYYTAFPGIPKYHAWCARQLQEKGKGFITTPLGRRRYFLGRPFDGHTINEAIAYVPQSMVGDILNIALRRMWHYGRGLVRPLLQVHDSVLCQCLEKDEEEAVEFLGKCMHVPVRVGDVKLAIPSDAETGWNWAKFNDNPKKGFLNPMGLKGWKGSDDRKREYKSELHILDRRISSVY